MKNLSGTASDPGQQARLWCKEIQNLSRFIRDSEVSGLYRSGIAGAECTSTADLGSVNPTIDIELYSTRSGFRGHKDNRLGAKDYRQHSTRRESKGIPTRNKEKIIIVERRRKEGGI